LQTTIRYCSGGQMVPVIAYQGLYRFPPLVLLSSPIVSFDGCKPFFLAVDLFF